jgi:LAS superfamily LD-carboxypeptidase LdcB
MANILAWRESEAPTALAGAERTTTGGEGANKEPQTLPPSAPVEESCNDARVLVERSHLLPPHYTPKDLVSLRSYGIPTLGNGEMRLRGEAAERLRDLVSAAATDGEELIVASAYRS